MNHKAFDWKELGTINSMDVVVAEVLIVGENSHDITAESSVTLLANVGLGGGVEKNVQELVLEMNQAMKNQDQTFQE